MSDEKCCATCAFLVLRRHKDLSKIDVAHHLYRDHGEPSATELYYESSPICFRRVVDLGEMKDLQRDSMPGQFNDWELSIATIQSNGRNCGQHFPWYESLSLKDHIEMRNMEKQDEFLERLADREKT